MTRPRWVFFDVGGVLEDETYAEHAALEAAGRALTLDARAMQAAFAAARPRAAGRSVIQVAIESLSPDGPTRHAALRAARDAYTPALVAFPDAIPALSEVRADGYRLGLLANQFPEALDRLDREQLLDFFEVIALPHLANARKPQAEIFRFAQTRAGVGADACAMVGDRLDADVAPARALGWKGVWVARAGQRASEAADATVASLLELPDALRAIWK
ncbi:MAG: HAD family hydrolase [Thermoplasmatota archaeon]